MIKLGKEIRERIKPITIAAIFGVALGIALMTMDSLSAAPAKEVYTQFLAEGAGYLSRYATAR